MKLRLGIIAFLLILLTLIPVSSVCDQVIDSYVGSNDAYIQVGSSSVFGGQAFTMGGTARDLCQASVYTYTTSVANNVYLEMRLYAATGTVGSTAVPTGSVLATSDSRLFNGASSGAFSTFTFSTPYTLQANTDYCIGVYFVSSTSGYVVVYQDDSSPSHGGNFYGASGAVSGTDNNFYVYYDDSGWTGKINGVTNPDKINGVSVANIASVNGVS